MLVPSFTTFGVNALSTRACVIRDESERDVSRYIGYRNYSGSPVNCSKSTYWVSDVYLFASSFISFPFFVVRAMGLPSMFISQPTEHASLRHVSRLKAEEKPPAEKLGSRRHRVAHARRREAARRSAGRRLRRRPRRFGGTCGA